MATAKETAPPTQVVFDVKSNARGMMETSVQGKHVSVEDLKSHILEDSTIWEKVCQLGRMDTAKVMAKNYEEKPKILDYLASAKPAYPSPVEFHVSYVSHVTDTEPFQQILKFERFIPSVSKLSWWLLNIKEEEIRSAEKRYLQKIFPNQTQEQIENHEKFLDRFTNSPAFQSESRYGNYRFTFPLAELMKMYQEQHCGREEPVLRVMKTMFYKKEILYGVLIHSPQHSERVQREFGSLPSLKKNSEFVQYQDQKVIWSAQAISDDLRFSLSVNTDEARVEIQPVGDKKCWYVWDHVCLAFYLPDTHNALKVPGRRLIEATEACKLQKINLLQPRCNSEVARAARFEGAKRVVEYLKQELDNDAEHVNVLRN
ncbi:hypothetical protein AMEX_G17410 [Astyanax mexicanus]|uniref:Uncharacterized protein n=1 Tax=Astyanax mexicanus TaxID=7994 RepID=A0A8T2LEU7_ASTMX|nr:hypothetical protein AMEX_G17410 [Astyanax mexicanus]